MSITQSVSCRCLGRSGTESRVRRQRVSACGRARPRRPGGVWPANDVHRPHGRITDHGRSINIIINIRRKLALPELKASLALYVSSCAGFVDSCASKPGYGAQHDATAPAVPTQADWLTKTTVDGTAERCLPVRS